MKIRIVTDRKSGRDKLIEYGRPACYETRQDPQYLHEAFKDCFSSNITLKGLVMPQSTTRQDTAAVRQWTGEFLT
jgi:hypothetical protein